MSTPWHLGPLASYDCETTGINLDTDRIVTAAIITPSGRRITWLTDVDGIEIPAAATAVHKVTTEHARAHGRPAKEAVDDIAGTLATALGPEVGAALVVMNAPFDLTILDRECARHGVPTLADRIGRPVGPVIDPLVLDRAADKYRKGKRTLEALAVHYGVTLTDAHTADADAQAALDVARGIAEAFPELQVPGPVVHGWQVTMHERWAAGLQEYFRRKTPGAVVEGAWPLVPAPRGGER